MRVVMSTQVEDALAACGRERVFYNDGPQPMVAIRWLDGPGPFTAEERWVRCESATHDTAGRLAAEAFAQHLTERAEHLNNWAERIRRALAKGRP